MLEILPPQRVIKSNYSKLFMFVLFSNFLIIGKGNTPSYALNGNRES